MSMLFNVIDDTLFLLLYCVPTALLCYMLVVSGEARGALRKLGVSVFRFFWSLSFSTPTPAPATRRLPPQLPRTLLQTRQINTSGTPISPKQWRGFATRKFEGRHVNSLEILDLPPDSDVEADTMLKREVERHNSAAAHKKLAKQLFSSSPPSSAQLQHKTLASSPPTARPLTSGVGSGNILSKVSGVGVKRHASGLAKTLSVGDGFDAPTENANSQRNPIVIESPRGKKVGTGYDGTAESAVYFDENDFDSDVDFDLEVEDPTAKGTVNYPKLPAATTRTHATPSRPTSRSNMSPTLSRQQSIQPTWDSGYESQQIPPPSHAHTRETPGKLRSTPASQLLPWSSSPPEHMTKTTGVTKTPVWDQYAYEAREAQSTKKSHFQPASAIGTINEERSDDIQPPPAKKRGKLPWMQRREMEEARSRQEEVVDLETETPKMKKRTIANFPWNTSASAIKEQQKQLRQAHKKMVKDNEPTVTEKMNAIAAKKKGQLHRVFLSEEQKHVLDLVVEDKRSVFFTGSAGTGKSVLLREIIAALRKKYMREPDRIAVTASTGLAACNIGGVTLHSFAGIGLGKEDAQTLVKKIRRNQKAKHRWMRTKVLVVDEVSMVDGELFDKLEEVARIMRNNGRPFGGIQLVITGDFFQLPPVPEGNRMARFAFEAGTWTTSIEHTIALHHVFRQKDPEFAGMLNEMREGRLSNASIARFRTLNRAIKYEDELDATELCVHSTLPLLVTQITANMSMITASQPAPKSTAQTKPAWPNSRAKCAPSKPATAAPSSTKPSATKPSPRAWRPRSSISRRAPRSCSSRILTRRW